MDEESLLEDHTVQFRTAASYARAHAREALAQENRR